MIFPVLSEHDRLLPVYLAGIGRQDQNPIDRAEGFRFHQLFLITHGCGELDCGGSTVPLKEGDCLFLEKNYPHSYHGSSNPFVTRWISFDGDGAANILSYFGFSGGRVFHPSGFPSLRRQHRELLEAARSGASAEALSAPMYRLLMDFAAAANAPETSTMDVIREQIRSRYTEDLSLDELAEEAGLSKFELCRAFRRAFGLPPIAFLIGVRLQNAKRLLLTENLLSIREISSMCGFHDPVYFGRVFKKQEGVTPLTFRRNQG